MTTVTMIKSTFITEGEIETEMPRNHCGLVDASFEEGHYESGLQVLDKLRSPKHAPSIAHLRQLLYIALYPPPTPLPDLGLAPTTSPRKISAQRNRRHLMPSPEASAMAISLLCAFARTNEPSSLFRAIPSYGAPGRKGVGFKNVADIDESVNQDMRYSPVGREAVILGHAKDCWALLNPGLVIRNDADTSRTANTDSSTSEAKRVVGANSWGLLEFFVEVFEEDEKRAKKAQKPILSSVLMSQIPHAQAGQPWNVERPLAVVFDALSSRSTSPQPKTKSGCTLDSRHGRLGIRLLSMLVNATMEDTNLISTGLVSLCATHLRALSFPPEAMQYALSSLPARYDKFTLKVICAFLDRAFVIHKPVENGSKSQNQVKPKPRVLGITSKTNPATSTAQAPGTSSSTLGSSSTWTTPSISPYPLPDVSRLLRHLSTASIAPTPAGPKAASRRGDPSEEANKSVIAKLHLLLCVKRILKPASGSSDDRALESFRKDWETALRAGRVKLALKEGFDSVVGKQSEHDLCDSVKSLCLLIVEDLEQGLPGRDATMEE